MRNTFFFDLDGTLLPMDMDTFTRVYFDAVKKSGVFDQISETQGREIFGKAVYSMMDNDGSQTNEELFFGNIHEMSGVGREALMPHIKRFYENEFGQLEQHTRTSKRVGKVIRTLQKKGYRLVLATNPLFPKIATDQRIAWAGLCPGDFEYISYYDNSRYCKPCAQYFTEILDHLGLRADQCYIVGNDVRDDMSELPLGFEGFLVLDHVIGDIGKVTECTKGDYSDLLKFAESLPQI